MKETLENKDTAAEAARNLESQLSNLIALANEEIQSIDAIARQAAREGKNKAHGAEIQPLASKVKEAIYYYTRLVIAAGVLLVPVAVTNKTESPEEATRRAAVELQKEGITAEQKQVYKPYISDLAYKGVVPFNYDLDTKVKYLLEGLIKGRENTDIGMSRPEREDAWRLYLGIPQKSNTFGVSDYVPSHGRENVYYYKINNYFQNFLFTYSYGGPLRDGVKLVLENIDKNGGQWIAQDDVAKVMGNFKFFKGKDARGYYLSYHDRWDLDVPLEKDIGFIGKPLEIYDRVYYNPDTFNPIDLPIDINVLKTYVEFSAP